MSLPRRRILFVDDEPHLLSGLRRLLRSKRDVWDMEFVQGGEEALALLAHAEVDLVVSDMRMPGMDGAQLLAAVRRTHPSTSRMILSGHADHATIISAIGPTQQYLAKPCDVDVLVAALERMLAIREIVSDEGLRTLLGDIESLPKPGRVLEDMMALAADPECRLEDVVAVIETDLSTSAEVLHLVNSAFFGLRGRVDTVDRAVHLLGLEVIQALAVAGAVFAAGGPPAPGIDARAMLRRGMQVGLLSRALAAHEGWPRDATGDAFLAGLLHEVGLPVLAAAHPGAWDQLRRQEPTGPDDQAAAQTAAFGCTATDASAYLLGLWGFPEGVVSAVAAQPADRDCSASPAAQLLAVARRWVLEPAAHDSPPDAGAPDDLCTDAWLTADRLSAWRAVHALVQPQPSCTSHTAPSGGTRNAAEAGRPCQDVASASTPPRLPTPEPP